MDKNNPRKFASLTQRRHLENYACRSLVSILEQLGFYFFEFQQKWVKRYSWELDFAQKDSDEFMEDFDNMWNIALDNNFRS